MREHILEVSLLSLLTLITRDTSQERVNNMTMKKIRKLEKDSKKKEYVFHAILNDVKTLKKNNDLSSTFKTHALKSLKKRVEILLKKLDDNLNQQIAFWENTKSKEIA